MRFFLAITNQLHDWGFQLELLHQPHGTIRLILINQVECLLNMVGKLVSFLAILSRSYSSSSSSSSSNTSGDRTSDATTYIYYTYTVVFPKSQPPRNQGLQCKGSSIIVSGWWWWCCCCWCCCCCCWCWWWRLLVLVVVVAAAAVVAKVIALLTVNVLLAFKRFN